MEIARKSPLLDKIHEYLICSSEVPTVTKLEFIKDYYHGSYSDRMLIDKYHYKITNKLW